LTEHDDVIKTLLRGAPRLGLALRPHLLGPSLIMAATNASQRVGGFNLL